MTVDVESFLDVNYAYKFAKKLETYKCNEKLGFRTAGSVSEIKTGNMIAEEMRQIGLESVNKDEINLDSWEFKKAQISFLSGTGIHYKFELGAYQTQFVTKGPQKFKLVYLGKGTAQDYVGKNVKNKLVLVDINQRDEWWINYPVYEAYLKGAAALIAVQEGGYAEIDEAALNAQDIAGPSQAAGFSICQKDADILKQELKKYGEIEVILDAVSIVKSDQKTYNIIGTIEGKDLNSAIMISSHYDSYFSGFQDDNVAVAMMLGIARAIKNSGYKPNRTLIFAAMAAEEWGIINSKYDWSTGAYEEVFNVHPEWNGKVILDINLELPAHAHGKKDYVRSVYEYARFIEEFIEKNNNHFDMLRKAYPAGIGTVYPVETWSDDFSIAISGIPSLVNDFSSGSYMETHYHSQFDNEEFYDEDVYTFHHQFYTKLLLAFDQTAVAPLDFSILFKNMKESIEWEEAKIKGDSEYITSIENLLTELIEKSSELTEYVMNVNHQYEELLEAGDKNQSEKIYSSVRELEKLLLTCFKLEQDQLVKLNWHDEVYFPHEIMIKNLQYFSQAIVSLEKQELKEALSAIYELDNNKYAFLFEKEVYDYFTDYVLKQPADRLKWGAGRIISHENLFDLVNSLKHKLDQTYCKTDNEICALKSAYEHQRKILKEVLEQEKNCLKELLVKICSAIKKNS